MMAPENAIEIRGLSKVYPRDLTAGSVTNYLLGMGGGKTVFRDISFTIPRGEVIGLIGPNGAGKSTLLRVIAGQATKTTGEVVTHGKLLAILQIATGLQDDWTGRENIRFLGALYGMSDATLAARSEDIISFAQLQNFIDYPVRTYSAGMRARLAFSLVTSADCDILLIDEALSVGDAGFAQRCRERMRELCRKGLTVIIVSHSTMAIRELCDRVLWLEGGKIVADGAPDMIVENYRLAMLTRAEKDFAARYAHRTRGEARAEGMEVQDLWAMSDRGRSVIIPVGSPFTVCANIHCDRAFKNVRASLEFLRVDGVVVAHCDMPAANLPAGLTEISADFGPMRLGRFAYECRLVVVDAAGAKLAERTMVIAAEDQHHSYNSSYYQPIEWQLNVTQEDLAAGGADR